ncbi:MAG: hypothetical protein M1813_004104 [Trichoglossum hirsutum]|nr:MAG: hypothetical protein M1813_004104 [Trichoglossum hirsutum]
MAVLVRTWVAFSPSGVCQNDRDDTAYWSSGCSSKGFTIAPIPASILSMVSAHATMSTGVIITGQASTEGTTITLKSTQLFSGISTRSTSQVSTKATSANRLNAPTDTFVITMNGSPTIAIPTAISNTTTQSTASAVDTSSAVGYIESLLEFLHSARKAHHRFTHRS